MVDMVKFWGAKTRIAQMSKMGGKTAALTYWLSKSDNKDRCFRKFSLCIYSLEWRRVLDVGIPMEPKLTVYGK